MVSGITTSPYDHIAFQQIDVEDAESGNASGLRMFGVTQEGHSVLAHITDFLPYFYIATPRGLREDDLTSFIFYLNVRGFPRICS